jgi:hypothetical protein
MEAVELKNYSVNEWGEKDRFKFSLGEEVLSTLGRNGLLAYAPTFGLLFVAEQKRMNI